MPHSHDLSGKRVLLTGSSGQLGKRLNKRLEQLGAQVVPFDIRTGHDFLCVEDIQECAAGCDYTIHTAGLAHPGLGSASDYLWNNVVGSVLLAEELSRLRHDRLVFVSSSAVYGWDVGAPMPNDLLLESTPMALDTVEPYTCSKRMTEHALHLLSDEMGMKIIVLRLAPIWEDHQTPSPIYYNSAVSPDNAVNAIIGSLRISCDDAYAVFNIADRHRHGAMDIQRALAVGLIV